MTPQSQHRAGHNTTFVAMSAQAHERVHELVRKRVHELVYEHGLGGANHALTALHGHAADALAGDPGPPDIGHEGGQQAWNERGLVACREISKLPTAPQARAGLIIPDLPLCVACATNAAVSVTMAPGRSGEAHRTVSQLPL